MSPKINRQVATLEWNCFVSAPAGAGGGALALSAPPPLKDQLR